MSKHYSGDSALFLEVLTLQMCSKTKAKDEKVSRSFPSLVCWLNPDPIPPKGFCLFPKGARYILTCLNFTNDSCK